MRGGDKNFVVFVIVVGLALNCIIRRFKRLSNNADLVNDHVISGLSTDCMRALIRL